MLKRFRVSTKLFMLTIITLAVTFFIGIFGIINIDQLNTQLKDMYKKNVVGLEKVTEAERAVRKISTADAEYLSRDISARAITKQEIRLEAVAFNKALDEYLPMVDTNKDNKERQIVNRLKPAFDKLLSSNESLSSTDTEIAKQIYEQQIVPEIKEVEDIVSELVEWKVQSAAEQSDDAVIVYRDTRSMMIYTLLAGLALSILLNALISRSITKPLSIVTAAAGRLAAGDFTVEIAGNKARDEIGILSRAFMQMIDNLSSLIRQIAGSAESIASAAEEMSAATEQNTQAVNYITIGAQELASGADKQNSRIQDAMASVEESSAGIQQISATAEEVASTAQESSQMAQVGNEGMTRAIAEMEKINSSTHGISEIINELGNRSQAIGQIVDLISGIADQTNLLALNAAIEAARAGEQGRGFAVVAEEVRKLAEQSSRAAKDIATLIAEIQADTLKAVQAMKSNTQLIENGNKVISEGAKSFQLIERAVKAVSQQVQEVSRSTEELSQGSEDIVNAVKAVGDIAQQVAESAQTMVSTTEEQSASIEEIASSADALAQLGQNLQEAVSHFKL
ncbi:MAG: methyl-accepting chemotaxis protein [Bacillota bacterium]